jgi:signal transduction histidine kinase
MVAADITDVARIWRNLLSNAIKYTPGPGTVRVFAGYVTLDAAQQVIASSLPRDCLIVPASLAAGKWVAGVVQDTGRGIPESDQPHIFARFYRGEAALTSIPGTGLGLSLVHELLENYEGAITLRSQPGSGSTFVFWLRAIDEHHPLDQG